MPLPSHQSAILHSLSQSIVALTIGVHAFGFSHGVLAQDSGAGTTAIASDLFQFPPESPEQLLEAAIITRQLNRQDDARRFLRTLLEKQLSEAELRALRQRVGSEPFLLLSGDRKMQPEGSELLHTVNAASKPQALSSAELQGLIQKLAQTSEDATMAVVALVANGNDSAAALIAADVSTPAGRAASNLLTEHAREMRFGLLSELTNADESGRRRILQLLGTTADPDIAPHLLRWQFDPDSEATTRDIAAQAIRRLTHNSLEIATPEEASHYLTERSAKLLRSAADRFEHTREPAIIRELSGRDRAAELLRTATSFLTDAVSLDDSNASASAMLLVARCSKVDPALSAAPSVATGQETAGLAAAFGTALELEDANAGIELLRAIKMADFSAIEPEVRERVDAALKRAVNTSDSRIRILAADVAQNVTHTNVSEPAVSRTLKSVRAGSLKPEAVVVDSDDRNLRNLNMALQNAGFSVEVSETGQDGFDAAVRQMNCELILVDAESAGWPLATTLANLRSDARTRKVPIVVVGPDRFALRVERLSEIYPGVWFIAEPVGIESLALKLESLLLPGHLLTIEDRAVMKKMAGTE